MRIVAFVPLEAAQHESASLLSTRLLSYRLALWRVGTYYVLLLAAFVHRLASKVATAPALSLYAAPLNWKSLRASSPYQAA